MIDFVDVENSTFGPSNAWLVVRLEGWPPVVDVSFSDLRMRADPKSVITA